MDSCQFTAHCPIYKYFKTKIASTIYRKQYCEGDYSQCQRYQLRQKGQQPPERLLPDGKMLTEYHMKN